MSSGPELAAVNRRGSIAEQSDASGSVGPLTGRGRKIGQSVAQDRPGTQTQGRRPSGSKWSKTIPSWTSAPYSSSVSKTLMRPSDNRRYLDFGSSRDRSLIQDLVQLLRSDESGQVRASAAMALGKFASLAQDRKILPKGRRTRQGLPHGGPPQRQ